MLQVLDSACNIAQCRSCGYIFDNPRPTVEELITFYSQPAKYDSWLSEVESRDRLWKRRLRKLRSIRKPGSLLDVGTGIGQFLFHARSQYTEVYGTEVSTTAIGIAKEKYGIDVFQGVIEDMTHQNRTFDNITLFHVLEHVPDPRVVLKTCHSLLSDGGTIAIAVPSEVVSLRAAVKRMLVKLGLRKPRTGAGKLGLPLIRLDGSIGEIHLSHFTPKVLAQLLESESFSVIGSTLDPYYVANGFQRFKADFYYYSCLAFLNLFRVNVYDAMLMLARKKPKQS
jgi:SAM-dependent methyltransferase